MKAKPQKDALQQIREEIDIKAVNERQRKEIWAKLASSATENTLQHKEIFEKLASNEQQLDFLSMEALNNREEHTVMLKRLDKIEYVVEKTYKLLDAHVRTQIRFDQELVSSRNRLDRHEIRISKLEKKV